MELLSSIVILAAGYLIGYYRRAVIDAVRRVKAIATPTPSEEPVNIVLEDQLSPAELQAKEQEQLIERLNRDT